MGRRVSPKSLALKIARIALDKKAREVVIIDISGKVDYADYLVVCSGSSRRHVKSIYLDLEAGLKKRNIVPLGVEGEIDGNWVLLDYGTVVAHVFHSDTRYFYDIDGLWLDAERISFEDEREPASE